MRDGEVARKRERENEREFGMQACQFCLHTYTYTQAHINKAHIVVKDWVQKPRCEKMERAREQKKDKTERLKQERTQQMTWLYVFEQHNTTEHTTYNTYTHTHTLCSHSYTNIQHTNMHIPDSANIQNYAIFSIHCV